MNNKEKRKRPRIQISEETSEGAIAGRQRLRETLLGAYAEVRIPKKIKTLLKDTQLTRSELFFKVWWLTPNNLLGNYTPQEMWQSGALGKTWIIDIVFALAGDQYELLGETIDRIAKARE